MWCTVRGHFCLARKKSKILDHTQRRCRLLYSAAISESVRNLVKEQLLEEISKPDSKVWNDRSSFASHPTNTSGGFKGWLGGVSTANGSGSQKFGGSNTIDDAICDKPYDALDEWHINAKPSRGLYAVPDGVMPATLADPFHLSKVEIDLLSEGIREDLIGTDHPVLTKAAAYLFEDSSDGSGGKKIRPVMVMLMSKAMEAVGSPAREGQRPDLLEAQRRLAQISEMIHTASLFHDDVIDNSDTRRNKPAVHKIFGNKMAILGGDYLLARASIYLARLRDVEVVETMSTIIEHLVRGEVMQMKRPSFDGNTADVGEVAKKQLDYYLRKNFYKTASLMANSCRSAVLLGNYDEKLVSIAYRYGKHVGLAFQLVDDILDLEGHANTMGKPSLNDLNAGIATAPVLFAAKEFPRLQLLIERNFNETGDIAETVDILALSNGMQRAKDLAHVHAEIAIDAMMELEASSYRDSLVHLAYKIIDRTS